MAIYRIVLFTAYPVILIHVSSMDKNSNLHFAPEVVLYADGTYSHERGNLFFPVKIFDLHGKYKYYESYNLAKLLETYVPLNYKLFVQKPF